MTAETVAPQGGALDLEAMADLFAPPITIIKIQHIFAGAGDALIAELARLRAAPQEARASAEPTAIQAAHAMATWIDPSTCRPELAQARAAFLDATFAAPVQGPSLGEWPGARWWVGITFDEILYHMLMGWSPDQCKDFYAMLSRRPDFNPKGDGSGEAPTPTPGGIITFPSNPPFNIHNQPLTWLYTHCVAIGMMEKSEPRSAEGDICLFTINLKARVDKAEREIEALRSTLLTHVATRPNPPAPDGWILRNGDQFPWGIYESAENAERVLKTLRGTGQADGEGWAIYPVYRHPAPSPDVREADLKEIARLIGSIYFYGKFVAGTGNERDLEALLIKTGYRFRSEEEVMAAKYGSAKAPGAAT